MREGQHHKGPFMPVTKTSILKSIKTICAKYDAGKPKGFSYKSFINNYDIEAITKLSLNEINGWTLVSNQVLKHQRVEGLKTFSKTNESITFLKVLEDIADFISSSQLIEDKLLKVKSTDKWDLASILKKLVSKFSLLTFKDLKKLKFPSFLIYPLFVALLCLIVVLGGWPLFIFNLVCICFAFWFIFFSKK